MKDVQSAQKTPTIGAIDELALLGAVNNVEDEAFVMKSKAVVQAVVDRLNLHTSYIVAGRVKDTDLYTKSPVVVAMERGELDKLKENIEMEMQMVSATAVRVKGITPGLPADTVFEALPALLHTPYGNIGFTRREGVPADYRKLLVSIRRPEAVIRACRSNLDIQQAPAVVGAEPGFQYVVSHERERFSEYADRRIQQSGHRRQEYGGAEHAEVHQRAHCHHR